MVVRRSFVIGIVCFFFVYYFKYVDNYYCILNFLIRFVCCIIIFFVLYREVEEGGYFFINIFNFFDLC